MLLRKLRELAKPSTKENRNDLRYPLSAELRNSLTQWDGSCYLSPVKTTRRHFILAAAETSLGAVASAVPARTTLATPPARTSVIMAKCDVRRPQSPLRQDGVDLEDVPDMK